MSHSTREEILNEAAEALAGLKDFQRDTVEYVFEQLYLPGGSGRFLVADEVGLGKTLIARGVVARTIEHLRETVERLDIVYVCSNADIARQNINRLRIGKQHVQLSTRLTLLPRDARLLKQSPSRINFVSFTPATSFDLSSGLGHQDERALLYALLSDMWGLGKAKAPMNVLRGGAGEGFYDRARAVRVADFDASAECRRFFEEALSRRAEAAAARGEPDLRSRFEQLCNAYSRTDRNIDGETSRERSRVVGELRSALAAACVGMLEPDLVILDEFQRFSHLLDGDDEAAELARALFDFPEVRTLLLSATPYKMYTAAGELGGDDHYRDFVRTVKFLEGEGSSAAHLDALLKSYRQCLLDVGNAERRKELQSIRLNLEHRLRNVMVRTERLAATPDRNGMLRSVPPKGSALTQKDALGYVALQNVAERCDHHDTLEYWKSAPYVLSFMDETYKLKRELLGRSADVEQRFGLAKALTGPGNQLLPWRQVERYGEVDPGNARMRALADQTVGQGAHRLLWIAPSLPYYRLRGPWAEEGARDFTKRLVFTSWKFAPRAIAALLSFEAERRMHGREEEGGYSSERRSRRGGGLRFHVADDRPTGMPVFALLYPSMALARACDPLRLAAETFAHGDAKTGFVDLESVLDGARMHLEVALRRLPRGREEGRVDERWYWAAPLLLDRELAPEATKRWFDRDDLSFHLGEDGSDVHDAETDGWWAHVEAAKKMVEEGGQSLGRRPDDLVEVLAQMAIASPGVTLLRSMLRVLNLRVDALQHEEGLQIRDAAALAASGFRSLFNQPEVTELIEREARGAANLPYWRSVLSYCADGCLQSVLDEYAHVLRDHLGLTSADGGKVHEIALHIAAALSLRTASLTTYDVEPSESGRTVTQQTRRMRCHFALRFGEEKSEDGTVTSRADLVRKAFNSPFWPFVMATTSVGQEGLDFHTYCHAVVHWNLPSNPVDLEQREGRVHRYKGHAVRKNVARTHGLEALGDVAPDVWERMFDQARRARSSTDSDIVPYWVYPTEDGARIERHVLALPLSREFERMELLSRSLALYRMVFGQPRQDDLLKYLMETVEPEVLSEALTGARIDLSPPPMVVATARPAS